MILKLEEDDNRPDDVLTMIPSTILVEEDKDVSINALIMGESNTRSQFYLNVINAEIAAPTKDTTTSKSFYPDPKINNFDDTILTFPQKDVIGEAVKSPGYAVNYKRDGLTVTNIVCCHTNSQRFMVKCSSVELADGVESYEGSIGSIKYPVIFKINGEEVSKNLVLNLFVRINKTI